MRMNIRRMAQGDRKHHKRSKRVNKVSGAGYKNNKHFYDYLMLIT